MATLQIERDELVLRLSSMEKLGAFRGDIRVPVSSVREVRTTENPWKELRGIRAPGTGFPWVISLCTRRGGFGKDFAAVYGKRPAVVVELEGAPFQRLVVTDDDAEATRVRLQARTA